MRDKVEHLYYGSITAYIIPEKCDNNLPTNFESIFQKHVFEAKCNGMTQQEMNNIVAKEFIADTSNNQSITTQHNI